MAEQTTAPSTNAPLSPTPAPLAPKIEPIKMVVMAPSGYGKTGLLASLLSTGYNVRVIDVDNGVKALRNILIDDAKSASPIYAKDSLSRLHWATITEPMKVVQGKIYAAKATVWPRAAGLLEHWKWEDEAQGGLVDLGKVTDWGIRDVLVIDTLAMLAKGALNYHLAMNGKLGQPPTGYEHQRNIGQAQSYCESMLQLLFDESIKCNVVINTHVTYSKEDGTMPAQDEQGVMLFGFPKAIGRSLGPSIPTYFRDVLALKKVGSSAKLITKGEFSLGLKSCASGRVKSEYDRATGLAEYFRDVQGGLPWEAPTTK